MQFDIASTMSTQQSGMHMSVSPDRGDGSRMSYLRFEDGTSGMNVFFDDVQGTTNPANFVETQIGTGLSRSVPHTVKLTLDAVDGPSNDVVKVWIDGTLVHTGTSWENYYRYDSESSTEQTPRIIKTILFRESGTAHSADAGNGFLIDNLSLTSGSIPPSFSLNDATTNGNNLTNHGATEWVTDFPFSTSTEAVRLSSGSSQYLSASDSASLHITGDITLEAWVRLDTAGVVQVLMARDTATSGAGAWIFRVESNNKVRLYLTPDGTNYVGIGTSGNSAISINTWTHVGIKWQASTGNYTYYFNGAPDGSGTQTISGNIINGGSAELDLGQRRSSEFLNGKLDEVRIWNTLRTDTQIQDNYNNGLTGTETGLVDYYPFETLVSSFDLGDKSGNANSLINHGVSGTTNTPFSGSIQAVRTASSSFQYLSANDSTSLHITGDITLETWVRLASTGEVQVLMSRDSATSGTGALIFRVESNNKARLYLTSDGTNYVGIGTNGDTAIPLNTWTHVGVKWQASTGNYTYYFNGATDGSGTQVTSGNAINAGSTELDLGQRRSSEFLNGDLDEVRVWNTLRTDTQIQNNYNSELTGSESGLAAYYPFESL